ncbi:MAG: Glutathione S-transferase domain protein [Frankiales bacterium]|nr:Glutathione S-transferase domain protein [Frankiales bacterium]
MTATTHEAYASPTNTQRYGAYTIVRKDGDDRSVYRFQGRVGHDAALPAESGRYHLWSGWFCPWAQRVALVVELAGLQDVVSVSYVDGTRDGRGWAFRKPNGPDPAEGFTLLRDAYEATQPGFDGHVSVPTLWDRSTKSIASNDYTTLDADLASQFLHLATGGLDLYPAALRSEIDELDRWLGPAVNHGAHQAGADPAARAALHEALATLDERLATSRYLVGGRLTVADTRLFVTLVRFDVTTNADRSVHPGIDTLPHLWRYARELYALPAVARTTDLTSFTAAGALVPAWTTS